MPRLCGVGSSCGRGESRRRRRRCRRRGRRWISESGSLHEDRSGALRVGRRRREVHTRVAEQQAGHRRRPAGRRPGGRAGREREEAGCQADGGPEGRHPPAAAAPSRTRFTASSRTPAPGSRPDAGRLQRHPGQRRAEEPRAAREPSERRRDPRGGEVQAGEHQRRAVRRRAGGVAEHSARRAPASRSPASTRASTTPTPTSAGRARSPLDYAFAHSTVDATPPGAPGAGSARARRRSRAASTSSATTTTPTIRAPVPQPDPNPLDCNGHGSHTAGTLAGFGVTTTARPTRGPYNASTSTNPSNWNVGPGVAPKADLYAYRVFGCAGSTNVVDLAINKAVADGMDVISMSLGSDFGGNGRPDVGRGAERRERRRLGRRLGR